MARGNQILIIIMTIMAGILVQGIYFALESQDSPNKAVTEFAKAYVSYNGEVMSERLCDDRRFDENETDLVKGYVYDATKEARDRGYNLFYMKDCLNRVSTETLEKKDNQSATIRLTAERRAWPRSFFTGECEPFEKTYEVTWVSGDMPGQGTWKVCGDWSENG